MRSAPLVLALLALGGGCSNPDPDWAKPCAQQRAPTLVVGGGASQFLPLGSAGASIEVDTTGTYVWVGVSTTGLGPDITVSCGIKDATTGVDLASGTSQPLQLTYDHSTNRDVAGGLMATLVDPTAAVSLVGTKVSIWADAVGCGRTANGKLATMIAGFDTSTCRGCLDGACGPQVDACGSECVAIQACLDAHCVNLSALASPDEASCQAYCQSLHPTGKASHVALVTCIAGSTCQPPCNGYSIDYDACVAAQNAGPCAKLLASCSGGSDCQSYKTCVSACSTWSDCQKCATSHAAGEKQFEAYEACLEGTCLTVGWVPH